jgi:hypothetical protein
MILNDCIEAVTKAAGRELSKSEVKQLSDELERRTRASQAETTGLSYEEAALKAADELGQQMKAAAAIERRNAAMNAKRLSDALTFVKNSFGDDPALGLQSILTGSQRSRTGARRSVAAEQEQLRGHYIGGLIMDLERSGELSILTSGAADRDIAKALWQLNSKTPDFAGLMPEAVKLAEVINKWQEVARADANKAGAWIGKLPGYIVRQSHDMWAIRSAGFERWRDDILPGLDLNRMGVEVDNIQDYLREVWTGLATGQHLKAGAEEKAGAFKGPANLAKKLSHERSLHFKDADAWHNYNEKYGSGNLREALFGGLMRSADATGLMRSMGTNPGSTFDQAAARIAKSLRGDPEKLAKFVAAVGTDKAPGSVRYRLMQVDGTLRIPVNQMLARASSSIRAVETMAKLGGSVISSVSDLPVYASEMRYQGKGFLSGLTEAIGGVVKGRAKGEEREILSSLGVVFDSMMGDITRWGSHDDSTPGKLARLTQTYFKLNLQSWWTDSLLSSAALSMGHDLGQQMGKVHAELRPELARTLNLYGITEADWNAVTHVEARTAEDGRAYLTPELARQIPDEAIAVKSTDAKLAKRERANYREQLEAKLRSFYIDRARTAVLHPDAETQAMMKQGTRPGTVTGEAARFIGQFKSFSISYLQKIVGREIYGRGADSLSQAMRNGNGEMLGLATIMLWTTAFGYAAMSTKDLLKGRTPRDPENYKTWFAAMTQGGGLGIYGDFLFGESNRFGGGLWATALGPTASTANDVFDLYQRVKSGDDPSAQALRVALSNTPFLNLFYTRMALDYLALYRIQEALNPGYLSRMEDRVEQQNHQTFWLRPTEAVR